MHNLDAKIRQLLILTCLTTLFQMRRLYIWAGIAKSIQRLAAGWTVRGSNASADEVFRTCPDGRCNPPCFLHNGYQVFSGGKTAGAWRWPHTPSTADVKERAELYFYSPSGPSWPVLGWNLLYLLSCIYRVIHKSLRDFRTWLRNNQDRHGRKEHINR